MYIWLRPVSHSRKRVGAVGDPSFLAGSGLAKTLARRREEGEQGRDARAARLRASGSQPACEARAAPAALYAAVRGRGGSASIGAALNEGCWPRGHPYFLRERSRRVARRPPAAPGAGASRRVERGRPWAGSPIATRYCVTVLIPVRTLPPTAMPISARRRAPRSTAVNESLC